MRDFLDSSSTWSFILLRLLRRNQTQPFFWAVWYRKTHCHCFFALGNFAKASVTHGVMESGLGEIQTPSKLRPQHMEVSPSCTAKITSIKIVAHPTSYGLNSNPFKSSLSGSFYQVWDSSSTAQVDWTFEFGKTILSQILHRPHSLACFLQICLAANTNKHPRPKTRKKLTSTKFNSNKENCTVFIDLYLKLIQLEDQTGAFSEARLHTQRWQRGHSAPGKTVMLFQHPNKSLGIQMFQPRKHIYHQRYINVISDSYSGCFVWHQFSSNL